jgi:hypothetical protein
MKQDPIFAFLIPGIGIERYSSVSKLKTKGVVGGSRVAHRINWLLLKQTLVVWLPYCVGSQANL